MKTYELTYIISSQLSQEESETTKNGVDSLIKDKGGIILRSEKLGAQPLSYHIKKQGSGYFNIETFQLEENKVKEIKDSLGKKTEILRSFILVKKPVRELKERRTRRPMTAGFETGKKPSIIEVPKDNKNVEKIDSVDLDKKLDEILND